MNLSICPSCNAPLEFGDWPFCPHGSVSAQPAHVASAERAVILRNPLTGEVRIPGRADRPIHPNYAAAGFVKEELPNLASVRRLEREKGLLSEVGSYDKNSVQAERDTGSNV